MALGLNSANLNMSLSKQNETQFHAFCSLKQVVKTPLSLLVPYRDWGVTIPGVSWVSFQLWVIKANEVKIKVFAILGLRKAKKSQVHRFEHVQTLL